MLEDYPASPFAQIVRDPQNYSLAENQSPASIYERLYNAFEKHEYQRVIEETTNLAILVSGTKLSPKVAYLNAMATGRLEGETALINALKKLIDLYPNSDEAALAKKAVQRLDQEEQLKHKRLTLKSYKWVFSFPAQEKEIDSLVKQMQNLSEAENKTWKFTQDVYNASTNFIVVHTYGEQPDQAYFLKKWAQLPNFEKRQIILYFYRLNMNKSNV